jgi:hypothetical protein
LATRKEKEMDMNKTLPVIIILLALVGGEPSMADTAAVRSKLESALVETDETRLRIADFTMLISSEDEIKKATRDEASSLLPIAQKCLRSPLKVVREYGLAVFFVASFRADSAELIAPYIDRDLAPFLNDQDLAVKREAIAILGGTNPRILPRALDILSAHLADKNNTRKEAVMIASTLIRGLPSDAVSIRGVLDFVTQHPELKLRNNIIQALGLNNVTTEEAIQLIHEGLADRDTEVRRVSAESVGHMRPENRAKFSPDLLRLVAEPNQDPEVRATAQRVLEQ